MQAAGQRHGHGGGGIPLVLAAGVHVRVRNAAHHRRGLHARRAERDQLGVKCLGHLHGVGSWAAPAGDHPQAGVGAGGGRRRRQARGVGGAQGDALGRQGHRTGQRRPVYGEGHVHGPVAPRRLAVLPGAVERIDDPDPAAVEPPAVVGRLLGEHRVVGTGLGEGGDEELVREPVTGAAQIVAGVGPVPAAVLHQPRPGLGRQVGRQPMVGRIGRRRTCGRTAVGGHAANPSCVAPTG